MSQSLAEHIEIKPGVWQRSRFFICEICHFFTLAEDQLKFRPKAPRFAAPARPRSLPNPGTTKLGGSRWTTVASRARSTDQRTSTALHTPNGTANGQATNIESQAAALHRRVGDRPALGWHRAHLQRRGRGQAARLGAGGAHAGPARRRAAVGAAARGRLRQRARRADRQPGRADGAGRAEGHLPVRLAGRRRREPGRARPTPTRACTRPTRSRPWSAGSTTRCCAPTRSPGPSRQTQGAPHWLAPIVADAEAGFGGPLNAFELMKAMIAAGAAGVHWEDQLASEKKCGHLGGKVLVPTGQHIKTLNAARLAADVCGVPTADRRPHRRPGGHADHQRRRRARPAVRHRRAHRRGLLPGAQRHRAVHRARPGLRAVRRPAVDGDLDAGPGGRPPSSPRRSRTSTRTRCWPTTARRRSTGARTSTTTRSRSSSASSARWATSSSSSPWPASTRSTTSMFDLARGYADRGMAAYVELQDARVRRRGRRLHRDPPPARGRHRLLRPGHARPSTRTPPPPRWPAPPRPSSSRTRTDTAPAHWPRSRGPRRPSSRRGPRYGLCRERGVPAPRCRHAGGSVCP